LPFIFEQNGWISGKHIVQEIQANKETKNEDKRAEKPPCALVQLNFLVISFYFT
jgi:hypothetical protein